MATTIRSFLMKDRNSLKNAHNKKAKGISFPMAFTIFILSLSILLGVSLCVLVFVKVDSLVRENRADYIQQEMNSIAREFQSYIFLRQQVVSDYANFPVVLQTAMHPKTNEGNIQDFINDLTILGSKIPLTLRDFEGNILYSTQNEERKINFSQLDTTEHNEPFINISPTNNIKTIHINLVVPIKYQHHIEGYLQADIPISNIVSSLNLNERSQHHRIQFKHKHFVFLDLGNQELHIKEHINIDNIGLTLSYQTQDQDLISSRKNLILEMLIWLAIIWFIVNLISNKLGKKYLIMPLEQLRKFSHQLADGKISKSNSAINSESYQLLEINDLEHNFQEMAKKVTQREVSLNHAKDSLQELNDRLVEHQQQLLHSEKLASVGQLAAGVAHEINNPTGFVMGNIEVLKDYKEDLLILFKHYQSLENCIQNQDMQAIQSKYIEIQSFKEEKDIQYILNDMDELIKDSLDGTNRIKNIVQDLKNFSRVDSVKKKLTDINEEVIETALRLVWNEIKYKCTLEKDLNPLPLYPCNSGELSQVILNLLVNASDAVTEKGTISISSHYMEDYIEIKISDNGSGINDNDLNKLFDPFFTTKEIGKGTGLGLSISHRIIEKHGGILSVASRINKGTVFTIMLPIE